MHPRQHVIDVALGVMCMHLYRSWQATRASSCERNDKALEQGTMTGSSHLLSTVLGCGKVEWKQQSQTRGFDECDWKMHDEVSATPASFVLDCKACIFTTIHYQNLTRIMQTADIVY